MYPDTFQRFNFSAMGQLGEIEASGLVLYGSFNRFSIRYISSLFLVALAMFFI